ncbi:hypothetical protein [Streptomyces sp. NBC_00151]|uniref:hypothetical protein n=1 Tax=Streptomyces sp. NBC_00151 TaxID=2975669 RepID=UPI002DDC1172|nr:hypothetical protein [Streptomyces sp. NBC_00151]WRZ44524.1 hypothetical protein OG915_44875 [Streptomyces sp. NBC_00151]
MSGGDAPEGVWFWLTVAVLEALPPRARLGQVVRAVTSDFEPARDSALAMRALDGLVDRLFGVGNDLVVPTEGVHRAGSYVVPDPLVVPSASAVAQGGFFRDAQVRAGLSEWLPGS